MTPFRIVLPALFFAFWLAGVLIMHGTLAGSRRAHYLEAGRKMAMVRSDYFPPRARLLDAEGTPLAWSERYFDLTWQEPVAPDSRTLDRIARLFPRKEDPEAAPDEKSWILRRDLTPDELLAVAPVLREHPALAIRSRLERIVVNIPELRERIGRTELRAGELRGVSGWEAEFDTKLRGTPGKYEVMLDRRRRWIDSTWTLVAPAQTGDDVRVPFRLGGGTP